MDSKKQLEKVYNSTPQKDIPWVRDELPDVLINLLDSDYIKPCKCIDLGCGVGSYSLHLAKRGFEVTGIDISPTAIKLSKKNTREAKLDCTFLTMDLTKKITFKEQFDFALDWTVLHHIFPKDRKQYLQNVHSLLNPGCKYLSVFFSEESVAFGGEGKFRDTSQGTRLYFSSESEMRELYQGIFNILELKTIEIPGKTGTHKAIYSLLEK